MRSMKRFAGSSAGFSMIEVLAAVLVLAVGVLGYAGLQARAMRSTGESYYRAQAMAIAQDLASRMKINASQLPTYTLATNWASIASQPDQTCLNGSCTPAQIATGDIADISYEASAVLTNGRVNVEPCINATSLTCVYVAWAGTLPTTGSSGQCVDSTGAYVTGSEGLAPDCVMLEAQI